MSIQRRPDFHSVIMESKQVRLPKLYVKQYWNGTPNPIFLRFPHGVQQKIFWEERDGDIWFQKNWEEFAKFLEFGYFLTFKYIGGPYFKVKIFNLSRLEMNYSKIRCVNEVGESKEGAKEIVELNDESLNESEELAQTRRRQNNKRKRKVDSNLNTTQPKISEISKVGISIYKRCVDEVAGSKEGVKETDESEEHEQTDRRKNNKRKRKVTTQPKISGRKRKGRIKEGNNESPYFEVTLRPSYVKGYMLSIPIAFSKKYLKKIERKAMIKVGEDMAMEVLIKYNDDNKGVSMKNGWKKFTEKYNLKIGDVCKFVMTQDQPLSFSVTITLAKKEKKPKKFLGVSSSDNTILKRKSIGGTSRGRAKGSKIHSSFKILLNCLYPKVPNVFMNGPKGFVELKMKEKSRFVKVNYYQSIKGCRFSGGWTNFRKDCKVEIGDTCHFELTDKRKMVFNVSFIGKSR